MVFLSIFAMIYNTFDKICAYEENTTFINICDRFSVGVGLCCR